MLHLIQEYATSRELISQPGRSAVNIRFVIAFSQSGSFASISKLGENARGLLVPGCPQFSLPELKAMGHGARHFLVDSLDVVALLTKKEDDEPDAKQTAKHEYFVSLLDRAASAIPELELIASGLTAALPEIQSELRALKAKVNDKATFAIVSKGEAKWLLQDDAWHRWYDDLRAEIASKRAAKSRKKSGGSEMRCLVTGELVTPVPTHNKVKGLSDVGGHTSGDILASFKQGAFQHFNLSQASNAAMSDEAMSLYVTTLNRLITQGVKIANRKVLYWYISDNSKKIEPLVDPLSSLFGGDSNAYLKEGEETGLSEEELNRIRIQAEVSARGLLSQFSEGGDQAILKDGRYVALSISANTTRVVIREVREGRFEELCECSDQWRSDLRICRINGGFVPLQSLNRLVTATLRERQPGEDFDKWIAAASPAYTSIWNAALSPSRNNISETIATQAFHRLRLSMLNGEIADALDDSSKTMRLRRSAYYARISILKLYLSRRGDQPVSDDLDEFADCDAYHAGRMLAVFQHIQTLNSGEPKASFLDRYYSAASTTPYQVLPRIWRIALNHLKRIKPQTLRDELTELLTQVHSMISHKTDIGRPLELADQFQFQLGFFQQQSHLPTRNTIRRVKTKKGYLVRSNAEASIADLLQRIAEDRPELGLNISYEPQFVEVNGHKVAIRGLPIKPDWIVQTNESPRLIILEHFGMRDLPEYSNRMEKKLHAYSEKGVFHVQSVDLDDVELKAAEALLVTTDETDLPKLESFQERFLFAIQNL